MDSEILTKGELFDLGGLLLPDIYPMANYACRIRAHDEFRRTVGGNISPLPCLVE